MLWIKAVHVVFVVAWFAGLFYLPRLFIYHMQAESQNEHQRFCTMERKLYGLMTIAMIGSWLFGILMLSLAPAYLQLGWLHAKLLLVILLTGYQGWLKVNMRRFAVGENTRSSRFWRIANEFPALILIGAVVLVIVKPF